MSAWRRVQIHPYLSPCTKHKSKWIKDLTLKPDTLNTIKEKDGGVQGAERTCATVPALSRDRAWHSLSAVGVPLTLPAPPTPPCQLLSSGSLRNWMLSVAGSRYTWKFEMNPITILIEWPSFQKTEI